MNVSRIGKRIVMCFEGDVRAVIHLMIAGRLTWSDAKAREKKPTGRIILAEFVFDNGVLTLQEATTRKRASIHVVDEDAALAAFDQGGLNVFGASTEEFVERLTRRNRTLKRALTDPSLFDGIGNAYSDEILFASRLSPVRLSHSLKRDEVERLRAGCVSALGDWRERLPSLIPGFPKPNEITAFRKEFAVHGKFGQPCPDCGAPVQRIVYSENETNYCASCQNEGRLLADRSLSRLLKSDWPKTLEEMVGG
jgi:formamidopyrimidine-DNA glycosylase